MSCYIGVSNILEEIVKYLMGCQIFGIYFGLKVKIMYSCTTKLSSVSAMFINRQGRSYLK